MPIEVALVDDHHLMRASLARLVNALPGYRVTLEAGNGSEFIASLATHETAPRIAIVDLNMPVMDGFATIAWVREHAPDILPIAISFDGDPETMTRAMQSGSRGFLLKTVRPETLRTALHDLIHTGHHGSPRLADRSPNPWNTQVADEPARRAIQERISPRELEFLLLACDPAEYPYNEIAARMDLPRPALEDLRNGLGERFGLTTRTALILFALRWGLLPGGK